MKVRKATASDIQKVVFIYEQIHILQEKEIINPGWLKGVYPIRKTAEEALSRKDLFVLEFKGSVVGSAIINHIQMDCYQDGDWEYDAPFNKIMVMHTLTIDPAFFRNGFAKFLIKYFEMYAKEQNCVALRIDTQKKNRNARDMYRKVGYKEIGIVSCVFNGIPDVQLVLLEKAI